MPKVYRAIGDRHPYEVYLLALAFVSSMLGALGITPPPASVRITLDPLEGRLWALSLAIGCAVALIGVAWRRPTVGLSVNGLILEQVGLVIVGAATIYYCFIAFAVAGLSALTPVSTVLAFGFASWAQAWRIRRALKIVEQQVGSP